MKILFLRSFLRWVMLPAGVGLALASAGEGRRMPNVLFVAIDDLSADLGCLGGVALTPHLDRLARSGILFERAYCQEAVCGPSRASVLSGLRPDTDQVRIGRGSGGGEDIRKHSPNAVLLPE